MQKYNFILVSLIKYEKNVDDTNTENNQHEKPEVLHLNQSIFLFQKL